jgi:dipeptidyl aminopeptidase/acylaminoacyl peptidase
MGHSEILLDTLKKTGVEAELVVIKDGGPGFVARENQDRIAAFFDRHLMKK